jgi:hypothetical protein
VLLLLTIDMLDMMRRLFFTDEGRPFSLFVFTDRTVSRGVDELEERQNEWTCGIWWRMHPLAR